MYAALMMMIQMSRRDESEWMECDRKRSKVREGYTENGRLPGRRAK